MGRQDVRPAHRRASRCRRRTLTDRVLSWSFGVLADGSSETLGAWPVSMSGESVWDGVFDELRIRGVGIIDFVASAEPGLVQHALRAAFPTATSLTSHRPAAFQQLGRFYLIDAQCFQDVMDSPPRDSVPGCWKPGKGPNCRAKGCTSASFAPNRWSDNFHYHSIQKSVALGPSAMPRTRPALRRQVRGRR